MSVVVEFSTMAQFYITLPSNSSMIYFPNNTLNAFTTRLPKSLDLKGEWEVGLSEIHYPRTWHNIQGEDVHITFESNENPTRYLKLDPGKYTASQLTEALNALFQSITTGSPPKFIFNNITQKISVVIKETAKVWITKELSIVLGFAGLSYFQGPQTYHSPHVCDMNRGFYSLYCYCSVVEPVFVGDVRVPLLRIVPITGEHGDTITQTYTAPQYMPVSNTSFDTIEINIKDDTGKPIAFERGKVVLTLHFRLRRSPYLL